MSRLFAIAERKRKEAVALPEKADLPKSDRDCIRSLRSRSPALIAEVKPRSPSAGSLLNLSQVPNIVSLYSAHAQAISVLCDASDFGGGFDLLAEVRAMTDLPILAKEFIVARSQIHRAREAGADAVLLIAAILSESEIRELSAESLKLGMTVLFEIHAEEEIEKVPTLAPDELMIGINNRDLHSLKVDLGTTETLAPLLRTRFPAHLLIAESGIATREDVTRLSNIVDGFLIGTTFLRAQDPTSKIRDLFDLRTPKNGAPAGAQCFDRVGPHWDRAQHDTVSVRHFP